MIDENSSLFILISVLVVVTQCDHQLHSGDVTIVKLMVTHREQVKVICRVRVL